MKDKVTMQIEKDINRSGSFVRTFAGYLVDEDDNQKIYHSFSNTDGNIEAVAVQDRESYVLRDNGQIEECSIGRKLEWDEKYELQLYIVSIENGENYIVALGSLNESIRIGESEQARIYIDGPDTVIVVNKKDSSWRFTDVLGSNYEARHYVVEDSLAQDFSSHSDFLRIGFEEVMPESITVQHP